MGPVSVESSVADVLRRRILSGELSAGSRLRQTEIATELGVSTTPVREALRSLTAEGLVEIDPHRGAIVRKLSHEELAEAFELILTIVQITFPAAVLRLRPEVIAEAEEIHERMLRSSDANEWTLLNRDFHLALSAPCERRRMLGILREMLNVSTIQLRIDLEEWEGRRAEAETDHARFIEVARDGDPEVAREIVLAHTGPALDRQRAGHIQAEDRPLSDFGL